MPCVNLQFNALSSGSAQVVGRVNALQASFYGCTESALAQIDFRNTETVAPRDPTAAPGGSGEVRLSWTPIRYRSNPGEYVVYASTRQNGPYSVIGRTGTKDASSFVATGLTSGTTYFFKLRTLTRPHERNRNQVVSPASQAASALAP